MVKYCSSAREVYAAVLLKKDKNEKLWTIKRHFLWRLIFSRFGRFSQSAAVL